jgi:hypothetical protein
MHLDLPQRVSFDDLPKTVCYRDIELFYLRDPDDGWDVLCAITRILSVTIC